MIPEDILLSFHAKFLNYKKGDTIFSKGNYPSCYYQIRLGEVKMNNYNEEGKEFIQNIFTTGQSFGEPPLFIDEPYPANAVALSNVELIALGKDDFLKMLYQHPEVSIEINRSLARRLFYKAVMAPEISSQDSNKRLKTLFDYQKSHSNASDEPFTYMVPLTRQQIADLTGLRVETVIRGVKELEKEGYLLIRQRKIFLK